MKSLRTNNVLMSQVLLNDKQRKWLNDVLDMNGKLQGIFRNKISAAFVPNILPLYPEALDRIRNIIQNDSYDSNPILLDMIIIEVCKSWYKDYTKVYPFHKPTSIHKFKSQYLNKWHENIGVKLNTENIIFIDHTSLLVP